MNDEHDIPRYPENTTRDHTPPGESEGIKVYDRPTRRPVPVWTWILLLLALAVIAWFALQALQ